METNLEPAAGRRTQHWGWKQRTLAAGALGIICLYILATPGGPLDKADLVAYAICHRIPSHSLDVHGRALPLCARCTGTYLGAMLALAALARFRPRASELPPIPIFLALLGFTGLMGLDGLNSYVDLLRGQPLLYLPQNWLRLLTGTLNGLMMGSILYPVTMGTWWRSYHRVPVLRNWKELAGLVVLALAAVGLVLTGWPIFLYPLAFISSAGILVMLTLVTTVMVLILARRENTASRLRDLALPLLIGLALSLLLIGTVDVMRYGLTGTLAGLPGLPQ